MTLLGAAIALAACTRPVPEETIPGGIPVSLETDPFELRALKTIPHVPAEGVHGPNGTDFFVQQRHPEIGQFPCSRCHTGPASVDAEKALAHAKSMHVDIQLEHAPDEAMNCASCHQPENPGQLRTLNGDLVSIDHAYQVCSQCHFEQARDWAGGAHGKRLAGWKGKRVIQSCTGCHDPHKPGFEARLPDPGPVFPEAPGGGHD